MKGLTELQETKELWNLGDGLENVCNSVMRKLQKKMVDMYKRIWQMSLQNRSMQKISASIAKCMEVKSVHYLHVTRLKGCVDGNDVDTNVFNDI